MFQPRRHLETGRSPNRVFKQVSAYSDPKFAEAERCLAAERKRSHGELANTILSHGTTIQNETQSYKAFQKRFGRSVKVKSPGMFVCLLRRKAESAGGEFRDLNTWEPKNVPVRPYHWDMHQEAAESAVASTRR